MMLSFICQFVGVLVLASIVYRVGAFVHLYFIQGSAIDKYLDPRANTYALVTGASDGIGLALVKTLLRGGSHVIIHSRNEEKLARITKDLKSNFPDRDVIYVAADATDPATAIPKVIAVIENVEANGGTLNILVNNIGGQAIFNMPTYVPFKDIPADKITSSVNLNAIFPIYLTKALLPKLSANSPSLILNLGSYAGKYPIPMILPYGISKAMVHHFSRILAVENSMTSTPVEVLGIMISQVMTTNQGSETTSFSVLSPERIAEDILARVGCGYDIVVGSWRHCITGEILKWLPANKGKKILVDQIETLARREKAKIEKNR
jgi:17beta-estradiol 17-dehydrogenase / very-long-chain 3-oxoacyl-CoA reductase